MNRNTVLSIILVLAVLTACAASAPDLGGTQWQLSSLSGARVIAGAAPTLGFNSDGSIEGWDGCNRFTGTYQASGSKLTIQLGASTMMACLEDNIMTQATKFTQALGTVASYKADKSNLTLKDASGANILEFLVLVPTTLTSGTWNVTGVNNGNQAVTSLVAGTSITAVFGADGSLSGNSGCNTYNTSYKVDGDKIKIEPAATTRMSCPEDVMAQEFQYLNALTNATTFSLGTGQLELRDPSGALQVMYDLK
jgi:heat shock protein HslJ